VELQELTAVQVNDDEAVVVVALTSLESIPVPADSTAATL